MARGSNDWLDIICASQDQYFVRAQIELVRLGYYIDIEELQSKTFSESSIVAMNEFQTKEGLFIGYLTEATLCHLIMV